MLINMWGTVLPIFPVSLNETSPSDPKSISLYRANWTKPNVSLPVLLSIHIQKQMSNQIQQTHIVVVLLLRRKTCDLFIVHRQWQMLCWLNIHWASPHRMIPLNWTLEHLQLTMKQVPTSIATTSRLLNKTFHCEVIGNIDVWRCASDLEGIFNPASR